MGFRFRSPLRGIFGVATIFFGFLPAECLADPNDPSFNYSEEQEIALSDCSDLNAVDTDVRQLGSANYSVRNAAQGRMLASLRSQIQASGIYVHCAKEKLRKLIQDKTTWVSAPGNIRPDSQAEVAARLSAIKGTLDGEIVAAIPTDEDSLLVRVYRPDDYVAAHKAIEQWSQNGCNVTGVSCQAVGNDWVFNGDEWVYLGTLFGYLGQLQLYECNAIASDCKRIIMQSDAPGGAPPAEGAALVPTCTDDSYAQTEQSVTWSGYTGPYCRFWGAGVEIATDPPVPVSDSGTDEHTGSAGNDGADVATGVTGESGTDVGTGTTSESGTDAGTGTTDDEASTGVTGDAGEIDTTDPVLTPDVSPEPTPDYSSYSNFVPVETEELSME